jgi:formamidase
MPKVAFHTNLKTTPEAAEVKTHNRWHPDIPMVETFKPGAEFRVECFDWTVRDVDLTKVHCSRS